MQHHFFLVVFSPNSNQNHHFVRFVTDWAMQQHNRKAQMAFTASTATDVYCGSSVFRTPQQQKMPCRKRLSRRFRNCTSSKGTSPLELGSSGLLSITCLIRSSPAVGGNRTERGNAFIVDDGDWVYPMKQRFRKWWRPSKTWPIPMAWWPKTLLLEGGWPSEISKCWAFLKVLPEPICTVEKNKLRNN